MTDDLDRDAHHAEVFGGEVIQLAARAINAGIPAAMVMAGANAAAVQLAKSLGARGTLAAALRKEADRLDFMDQLDGAGIGKWQ
ncbi:hypothetical protein [uncultured Sphingomonas sp.]|uniref:hypothetical protein n=1 Tax=uncultured Sphingomonas sp. TaxID=158754 RepID=UPI0025E6972A|nr:hypothetical protein [uncultured Sphingomonas sp.]